MIKRQNYLPQQKWRTKSLQNTEFESMICARGDKSQSSCRDRPHHAVSNVVLPSTKHCTNSWSTKLVLVRCPTSDKGLIQLPWPLHAATRTPEISSLCCFINLSKDCIRRLPVLDFILQCVTDGQPITPRTNLPFTTNAKPIWAYKLWKAT